MKWRKDQNELCASRYVLPKNTVFFRPNDVKNPQKIEIEVIRDRNLVRIRYKGFSEKFDEWRPILLTLTATTSWINEPNKI